MLPFFTDKIPFDDLDEGWERSDVCRKLLTSGESEQYNLCIGVVGQHCGLSPMDVVAGVGIEAGSDLKRKVSLLKRTKRRRILDPALDST